MNCVSKSLPDFKQNRYRCSGNRCLSWHDTRRFIHLKEIQDKKIPYVVVKNKSDLCSSAENSAVCPNLDSMPDASFHIDASNSIEVSTVTGYHVHELKELIASQAPEEDQDKYLVRDLLNPNDFVVLVVPIDSAAPKGRLILPQQQTIRDVLEAGAISIVTRDTELKETLRLLAKSHALSSPTARRLPKYLPIHRKIFH